MPPPNVRQQSRFLRWCSHFLGGILFGVGMVVFAQVAIMRVLRDEVEKIGGMQKFFGRMTFVWRKVDEKFALACEDVPEEVLVRGFYGSLILMVLGLIGFGFLFPLLLRWITGKK